MGRGRQKAKQMKVARRLKYFSPETDLDALQRELSGHPEDSNEEFEELDEDFDDKYYVDDWDDSDRR
ncbi:DUF3073 domain-containing protein [Scrofimicrobium sp. R131]|uniref:DUF3073 domain-containing protein n=1 Tax=Scrofimicrobium appendicitidis TaxID=3079930 RepID=A0AAU7V7B4_9ACTO